MAKKERRSERTRSRVKARVTAQGSGESITGLTRDISRDGLFIQTSTPLPPGTRIKVELIYRGNQLDLEGVVVRADRAPTQLGGLHPSGMGIRVRESTALAQAVGTPRETRIPLGSDVVVFFGSERLRLKLHDLSASGAAFIADKEVPDMTFVRMHLKLQPGSETLQLEGVPVGKRPLGDRTLVAINFLDPPTEVVARIEALIGERSGSGS